jgi:hypothetical protein
MFKYDISYFYNMLRMYCKTAEQISRVRWEFVKDTEPKTVLDYGCGCGFFKAFAPEGISVDTFDIMPVPMTGITKDAYDLVTFWDVLEHIPDFNEIVGVFNRASFIAITVPIKPKGMRWKDYKHFKPLEHIHHFTEHSLVDLMEKFGFVLIKSGTPECPPRDMIHSFLFAREYAKADPK